MLPTPERPSDGTQSGDVVTIVAHDVGGVGGMERQLGELITGLLGHGAAVTVVSRTLKLPPHQRLRWCRVPGPSRPFTLAYPWFAIVASLLLLRERRGLLHTTGAIVLNRADVCTVHYVHASRGGTPRRMRRATGLYRLNAAAAATMSRLVERAVYSSPALTRLLVAVSEPVAEELRRALPARAAAVRLIENGVDVERFRPDAAARDAVRSRLGIGEAELLAVFVGSEWRSKGLHIAIEALAAAPSWQLAAVGSGDVTEARRTAERLGVVDRLHLVPETPFPERYYAAGDAFVLPSAYESFSIAAFEAAASGVPVLGTEVGAVATIVDGGGGLFIDRSPESLGAALQVLEADAGAAAKMAENARHAVQRFSWDVVVGKYLDLYRRADGVAPALPAEAVTG